MSPSKIVFSEPSTRKLTKVPMLDSVVMGDPSTGNRAHARARSLRTMKVENIVRTVLWGGLPSDTCAGAQGTGNAPVSTQALYLHERDY